MKQQLQNAKKYKDVIKEEKDLTALVGQGSDFDVDTALRDMLRYYDLWKGNDIQLIDRVSVTDEEIVRLLKAEMVQDRQSSIMTVDIKNFPNEAGYFMLWELSVSNNDDDKRIIPIFVNDSFVLRPLAGKRLFDVFLDESSQITVSMCSNVPEDTFVKLQKMSSDFAYDTFIDLKDKYIQRNEESYRKYMYALQLRKEAAEHIGIENIRTSRLEKIRKEEAELKRTRAVSGQIYPDFKLVLLARLEA